MNTRRIPAYGPGDHAVTNSNLRTDIRQQTGPWREFILWPLLIAFLLMLLADAAYAMDRRNSARARSPNAGVPTYNIEAICRGAASISRLLETTAPDNAQNCREDEHHAREQLLQQWTQFDAADRVMCDGAAQSGAVEPTYTELMTCLEMTRDNLNRQASAHVAQRSEQPQSRAAVATAPVQGPRPIRNALAGR
jgi:hypothetical protein